MILPRPGSASGGTRRARNEHGVRGPRHQWGGTSARRAYCLRWPSRSNARVDACTHECGAHDIVYDGALEAEPRLLKQTRNFLLRRRASANQTFQAGRLRRCDTRAWRRAMPLR